MPITGIEGKHLQATMRRPRKPRLLLASNERPLRAVRPDEPTRQTLSLSLFFSLSIYISLYIYLCLCPKSLQGLCCSDRRPKPKFYRPPCSGRTIRQ